MRKYLVKILIFLLAVTVPLVCIFAYIQSLPRTFGQLLMGTTYHKYELLTEEESPKIILIGGSSSPYATDCAKISEAFGMPCINIGVTSYYGIDFYYNMLKDYMHEGDIVILSPEAAMMRDGINYEVIWEGVENYPELLKKVPLRYWRKMFLSYYIYADKKFELLGKGYGTWEPEYKDDFGYYGDATEYRETKLEYGYLREDPITLDRSIVDRHFIAGANRLAKAAEAAGARLFFYYPPVDVLAVTSDAEEVRGLDEYLREKLDVEMINSIEDSLMEGRYFYDSNNHLTSEGQTLYTERLIDVLRDCITAED